MNRAGRIVTAIVALGLGGALVATAPETSDVTTPIEYRGAVGDRIAGRAFAVTVTSLTFADRLELRDGTRVDTPGTWLLVHATVTPRLHLVDLGASSLRVGGTTYGAYADPDLRDLSGSLEQPGITVEGTLAFEVPRSVRDSADADLVIDRGTLVPDQVAVVAIHPDRIRHVEDAVIADQDQVGAVAP